jgi:hypothetical protein
MMFANRRGSSGHRNQQQRAADEAENDNGHNDNNHNDHSSSNYSILVDDDILTTEEAGGSNGRWVRCAELSFFFLSHAACEKAMR